MAEPDFELLALHRPAASAWLPCNWLTQKQSSRVGRNAFLCSDPGRSQRSSRRVPCCSRHPTAVVAKVPPCLTSFIVFLPHPPLTFMTQTADITSWFLELSMTPHGSDSFLPVGSHSFSHRNIVTCLQDNPLSRTRRLQ